MKTLADLKAENLAEETLDTETPQGSEEEVLEVEDKEESQEPEKIAELDQEADEDTAEGEEAELEDWQKVDESADKKFTDSDIGAAKRNLRAKMEKKHETETDTLRAEIERLKIGGKPQQHEEPKYEDFLDTDDPEGSYRDARIDWKFNQKSSETEALRAGEDVKLKQDAASKETETAVNQHYVRAAELADKSGISPEVYQSSDLVVRQAIESVFPNRGDAIADSFIASLGEGSEKVLYNLGVNKARLAEFKNLLMTDSTGLKAFVYGGSLKSQLNAPSKRKTNAPAPAANADGESSSQGTASERKLKKIYDGGGSAQDRFNARREAKKAGINVNSW